jgi:hypothetical protein
MDITVDLYKPLDWLGPCVQPSISLRSAWKLAPDVHVLNLNYVFQGHVYYINQEMTVGPFLAHKCQ